MIQPGKSVRGSRSGRPIMVLFELLQRRWTLRLIWELRDGPLGFRALQERCDGVSPTSLSRRLKELRGAGIVDAEIGLTQEGKKLLQALGPLNQWAERWAATFATRPGRRG
jgi:DNA-binding HxlR family transcriptional regulator